MKLSKKVLAAFASMAAVAMVGTFVSCTEEDDDTEGAITGSGKNYSINYTNTSTTDIYRCWNTTTFKHEGELVKITFNDQSSSTHNGAMGFVWDLGKSKNTINNSNVTLGATEDTARNFLIVGFRNKSGLQYYVSKYFNVTDLQAENFGATDANAVTTHDAGIAKSVPCEIAVKGWTSISDVEIPAADAEDKTVSVWVDIYPLFANSTYGVKYSSDNKYTGDEVGVYVVDIYAEDPTAADFSGAPVATTTISADITGYNAEPKQNTLAVYANVQPSKTLSGAWNLAKDYAADEVVED